MRVITALFFLFFFFVPSVLAQLQSEFYSFSCPTAEIIVANVVANHMRINDKTTTAALLRMQFQDCFVNGCDASILIDPNDGRPSEKSAGPNTNMRGFEIIDKIKNVLESMCPQTVSCADIIALATRDAVVEAGVPYFSIQTGRRDGLKSDPKDVNLPGPTISVAESIKLFGDRGMNVTEMVALIGGGHSVGVAHCSLFKDRLNDPAMNRTLNARLKNKCSAPNDPMVSLDQKTPFTVDNAIYGEIQRQRGILRIDQNLGLDTSTRGIVSSFASSNTLFRQSFTQAMVKMGTIRVLTGRSGEIRRNCRVFNNGR